MKYAELPGNKMLKFADDTPDEEIQKVVRRHLGITQDDLIVAMGKLVDRIEGLVETIGKHAKENEKSRNDLVEAITDSFDANTNRLTGVIADAVKEMGSVREQVLADLKEIMEEREESKPAPVPRFRLGGYVR